MAKKKKGRVVRALPPSTATPEPRREKPTREVIEIHTTRERKRNASGGLLDGKSSTIVPVLGGIAGGTAAVLASQKWNASPGLVAAGTAAAGLAAMTMGKQPWLRQAGAGAVVGAAVVGAVPLVVGAFHKNAPPQQAQNQPSPKTGAKRSADGERDADPAVGDGFVTRRELNDALSKLADSQKETSKQQTCDLMTALCDEIRKVIAEGPNGPGAPVKSPPPAQPYTYPFPPPRVTNDVRGADYSRNAYSDDFRDADGDDYSRNAYGDDMRDAEADDYSRNAYGDDIRDAEGDDYSRNAYGDDMRDADMYERDADGYERATDGYERDADGYAEAA